MEAPIGAAHWDRGRDRTGGPGPAVSRRVDDVVYLVGVRDEARALLDPLSADTRFVDVACRARSARRR